MFEHNGYVQVTCNAAGGFFDALDNPDLDGKPGGDLGTTGNAYTAANGLVFVKDQRSTAADEKAMATSDTMGEGDGRVETKTSVKLVGGRVFADLNMSGSSAEALDRLRLHQDCAVGTDLPMIKGDWRGVVKTETKAQYRTATGDANDARGLPEMIPGTMIVTTTKKICVRLDAMPGSVKCYIRTEVNVDDTTVRGIATGMADSNTEMIATYADGEPTAVRPMPIVATTANNPAANELFIGSAATGATLITVDDFRGEKLCSLFREGAHATVKITKPQ